jgi:predicted AlkP superfamily phosphohydrolase/phosphomutase
MKKPVIALLIVSTLLLSCGGEAPPVPARLIILGFDGMDPALARQWMDDGSLPNFSALAQRGSFQPLATSNPPQSPVAWSDFATGTGPGDHGIYDFLRRDVDNYAPAFSISEVIPPQDVVSLFGMELPLDSGSIVNRRLGTPFWTEVEEQGGRSTVLRVPVTFPPDPIHRMMSGMGVPDLLGTQGTYTIYTTRPVTASAASSTRSVRIRPNREGHIETRLEGPAHPLKPDARPLSTEMLLDPAGEGVRVRLGDADVELDQGEWSDWITVSFDFFGPASVEGIVRLYLLQSYPQIRLYVSPIHIDPRDPVVPLSSPPDYVSDLAEQFGLFHTIGMPEETWSLNEGHLSDHAWLEMVRTTLAEREAIFFDALDRNDSHVVTGVFVQTDRVSHMFYRGIDPEHPLYGATDEEGRNAIHWIYTEADRVLGETVRRMGPHDRLIVLSDHGFAPFRRAVNLNRWLLEAGYLTLKEGKEESGIAFSDVDWTRSRAYALGLNSLFINRQGREAQGIVKEVDVELLKAELMLTLPGFTDPDTGHDVVAEVFDGSLLYPGNAHGDAPDLVIGYHPSFRASWQTTLGGVPETLVDDNARKWSGDHCITPTAVPGVLFTSFAPDEDLVSLASIARYARNHWDSQGQ